MTEPGVNDGMTHLVDSRFVFGNGQGFTSNGVKTVDSGQYVRVAVHPVLDITGDITIAAWVKPEESPNTQDLAKKAASTADGINPN